MAIPATQMRPGMIIKHNNELHAVFAVEHRTPGNLRAFIQAKLRNLRTGAMFEHRFRSPDLIERVVVDETPMEFLYADGDDYYFMKTRSTTSRPLSSRPPLAMRSNTLRPICRSRSPISTECRSASNSRQRSR